MWLGRVKIKRKINEGLAPCERQAFTAGWTDNCVIQMEEVSQWCLFLMLERWSWRNKITFGDDTTAWPSHAGKDLQIRGIARFSLVVCCVHGAHYWSNTITVIFEFQSVFALLQNWSFLCQCDLWHCLPEQMKITAINLKIKPIMSWLIVYFISLGEQISPRFDYS